MPKANPIASLLAEMTRYTSHGNRWHKLEEAVRGLRPQAPGYKPVRVP